MHLVMFDIDGTLVNTADFEDVCYLKAIQHVVSEKIDSDWSNYNNATDSGILDEIVDNYGLGNKRDSIHYEVRQIFTNYIKSHLQCNRAIEIDGASEFIRLLKKRGDVVLSIATGGWEKTAKLKLKSAGIDYSEIAFASGSDSISRLDIMKLAEKRCLLGGFTSKTYFGDAIWDKKTSLSLAYNFILVGNGIEHTKQIIDFKDSEKALSMIGL